MLYLDSFGREYPCNFEIFLPRVGPKGPSRLAINMVPRFRNSSLFSAFPLDPPLVRGFCSYGFRFLGRFLSRTDAGNSVFLLRDQFHAWGLPRAWRVGQKPRQLELQQLRRPETGQGLHHWRAQAKTDDIEPGLRSEVAHAQTKAPGKPKEASEPVKNRKQGTHGQITLRRASLLPPTDGKRPAPVRTYRVTAKACRHTRSNTPAAVHAARSPTRPRDALVPPTHSPPNTFRSILVSA